MLRVAWWIVVAWAAWLAAWCVWDAFGFPNPWGLGTELLFYLVSLAVLARYARRSLGAPWSELAPLKPFAPSLVIAVVLLTFGLHLVSLQLLRLCMALDVLPPQILETAGGGASAPAPHVPLYGSMLSEAVFPGFFEEATFRGLILCALAATMSKRRAIVVSAVAFAATHFSIERMPYLALLGAIYAWMALRTGSLVPGMLAHALHNCLCVLTIRGLYLPDVRAELDANGLLPVGWVWLGVALAAAGILWILAATRTSSPGVPQLLPAVHGFPLRRFATAPAARLPLR